MVYEGANGQTAKEIQNLFLFPKDDNVRLNGFYQMITSINQNNKTYQLYSANSIWIEKNFEVFPNYLNKIKQYYLSSVEKVEFINKTKREESRKKINNWVENKTNQKIKELLQKGVFNEYTRIVIVNAIYFKSEWESIFQKELTKEEEFKIDEKNKILVKMMNKTGYFNYFENEKSQCLEIPYKENELSMFILLPKNNLQELEKELDYNYINNTIKKLQTTYVELRLPKFKIEKTYALKEILQNMGLKTAFNVKADFSLITKEKLSISYVIHKTFVEVNEEGTEAAGATAITMSVTSIPSEIKIFHANKPFIFFIQHKKTNAILFIGKLYNPSEK
jgi:serpin B